MRPGQIIVLATPVFFLLIAIEFAVGRVRARRGTGHDTYRLADAVNSIGLGMLSQISAVLTGLLRIGIYTAVYSAVALFPQEAARDFWTTWYGWLLALVFYDFCYYWLHRMGHESAVLWAAHVVHHQSQHYNLSTALRQTSSGALLGWLFYLPMAVAGVPPLVFAVVALVDLLYQFWVHTEQVGKLGWFDRWFCSPSNHRVHHAVNDTYLDRNYGGVLIVWDRLFGTFREEDERCVYGTRGELQAAGTRCGRTPRCTGGWPRMRGMRAAGPTSCACGSSRRAGGRPTWRRAFRSRPSTSPRSRATSHIVSRGRAVVRGRAVPLDAGGRGLLSLVFRRHAAAARGRLAGRADGEPVGHRRRAAGAAVRHRGAAGRGGRLRHGRARHWTSTWLHHIFKPLALSIAIVFAARRAMQAGAREPPVRRTAARRAGRLARGRRAADGLRPTLFVPGLVCFLLAHLAYIALFRIGVGLFPRRGVLAATLLIGVGMYAFLWQGGLPPALANSGRCLCAGDRLHGGAGHRAGSGAARTPIRRRGGWRWVRASSC
jgi:alkylglycerol monooxygenase